MEDTTASDARPQVTRRWQRYLFALLFLFLIGSTVFTAVRAYEGISRWTWDKSPGDFRVFYWAGDLILSDDRGGLYDLENVTQYRWEHRRAIGSFYNPPAFALLFAPLTAFSDTTASSVNVVVGLTVLAAVVVVLARQAKTWPVRVAVALAVVSFWPGYVGLQLGHPSFLLAALATAVVLLYLNGRSAAAGAVLGIVALKPTLFLTHAGLMFWREDRRALVALVVVAAVLVLAPFLVLGVDALRQYMHLLSASRQDAFTYSGSITAGAAFMFNWNGFIAKLFVTDPRPVFVFPLYLATVALMIKAWASGDFLKGWLAASVTAALVTPHFLFYDLTFLVPSAVLLALRDRGVLLIGLLAVTHLAVNLSMLAAYDSVYIRPLPVEFKFIAATPMLALVLAYLAFQREVDGLLARLLPGQREGTQAPVATAP